MSEMKEHGTVERYVGRIKSLGNSGKTGLPYLAIVTDDGYETGGNLNKLEKDSELQLDELMENKAHYIDSRMVVSIAQGEFSRRVLKVRVARQND
ncbi:MAG: hypothetical protein PXY39_00125 [archaeon]|nr:hypothetical protein [archaeon]